MSTTLSAPRARGNRKPAKPLPSLSPVLAHALAVAAKKPAKDTRDDLAPGQYCVSRAFRIAGTLNVGHDTETAATVTPDADLLLGLVLAKLNAATRHKILNQLPADFAAAGAEYPAVPAEIVAETEILTASLRRKVSQRRRGAVTGSLTVEPLADESVDAPDLLLVG